MKKTLIIVSLTLIALIVLTGCFHKSKVVPNAAQTSSMTPGAKKPVVKITKSKSANKKTPSKSTASRSIRTISVEAGNVYFKPETIRMNKNETVRLNIKNSGGHTLTAEALGINLSLNAPSVSKTFTPKERGLFPFYCGVPGHAENGMKGVIIVE